MTGNERMFRLVFGDMFKYIPNEHRNNAWYRYSFGSLEVYERKNDNLLWINLQQSLFITDDGCLPLIEMILLLKGKGIPIRRELL